MKVTFQSEDPKAIKRLAKSEDMAIVLFEIQQNLWRRWKHTEEPNLEQVWEAINELYDEHGIDVNDLIE
jgi:hypothetical protein